VRQRALFTGRCIAPTLGGANGVQLSCLGVSEAPQATPQPTCWLVTPGHIFVGLVTHPRVSHLHLRSSHAYSLFAARALLLRGGCCVRARCYLGGRAGRMDGRLTFFWSVCISAVTHSSSTIVLHQLSNPATLT
jgi:hypothetical protein